MNGTLLKHDRYRRIIEHEDNLVNHRVSWLLIAQSFLLGACVAKGNYPYFIIFLGIFSTAVAYISILAAIVALKKIKKEIENDENNDLKNYKPDTITTGCIFFCGELGAYALPVAFLLAWIYLAIFHQMVEKC